MPKSKNRKNHSVKSEQRTLMIKRKEEKKRKDFFNILQKAQQDAQEKSLQEAKTEQDKLIVETKQGEFGDFEMIVDEPIQEPTQEVVK